MAPNGEQETLDRILEGLKSSDSARCWNALQELNSLNFSSPAILRELERLAIHGADEEVRKNADELMGNRVHRFIRSNTNKLNHGERALLLQQIEQWEADELLGSNVGERDQGAI